MTPVERTRLTVAGIVTACTLISGALGSLGYGIIGLNEKLGASRTQVDSLVASDSMLFAQDSLMWKEVKAIKRFVGMKAGSRAPAIRPSIPKREGLVRRFLKELW